MDRRAAAPRRIRRTAALATALVAAVTAFVAAPSAQAGLLVSSAEGCPTFALENPFVPWADPMDYVSVPGGTFEDGAGGWSLGGTSVVSGNEPYYVHGAGESKSLSIGAGESATTGTMCVGLEEPTLRFFSKASKLSLLSSLKVDVLFETANGNVISAPVGVIPTALATSWTPHLPMAIVANLLPLINDKTPVRFRFTALGSASWQIDDVYVDPRYR